MDACFNFSWVHIMAVEGLGHAVDECLLLETARIFSKVVVPFYIPPTAYLCIRVPFLHIHVNTCYRSVFDLSHSSKCV